MTGSYNLTLVALSYLVATLASYVALNLAARMSAARGRAALYWLVGGAAALGSGIWSMHFIGMLAFSLPIPTAYDMGITLLSLLIAVLVSGFALFTINRRTLRAPRLLASGTLMGLGIAAMHYTGMASTRMFPPIHYDPLLLALSLGIAVAAAVVALWIAFRLRSSSVDRVVRKRIASAFVLGLAIAGTHYVAMAAAQFDADSVCLVAPQQISTVWLATTTACCAVLLLCGTVLIRGGERALMTDVSRPMAIRLKIGLVFLVVVAMVAAFVVASMMILVEAAELAALHEAEDVALTLAQATGQNAIADPVRAQRYLDRVYRINGRDMSIVDTRKSIVADVQVKDVGTTYAGDADNAVGKTLDDGRSRTFLELDPRSKTFERQFVAALHHDPADNASRIVGAVILEYTQIYEAFHAEARTAAFLIAAIGLAVVFVTSVLGFRVAATIAPRLVALKRGAESLAAGNYGARVGVSANDEIGALASAFNRMAVDLEASHGALVDNQRDLESRVEARTAELRDAEERQRLVADELRLVSEHLPVGLCYLDRDLRFHHHNNRFLELTGLTSDPIYGHRLPEVFRPELYARIEDSLAAALAGQQVICERPKVLGDEQSGNLQTTLVPRIDGAGAVVGVYAMVEDITERKRAEDALRRSNEKLTAANTRLREAQSQLLQAGKMASIGQLASGVAHEINNPIGYVWSNLGTLEHYLASLFALLDRYEAAWQGRGDAATRGELQAARETADIEFVRADAVALLAESKEGITRVKQIVLDLKNFSRSASDEEWQWADLHHGIDSTLNIVMNELKYKAEIQKHYGALPNVQCRPSQLNQVFLNLLVNSADAMQERGTIAIRSGVEGEQVWVEFEDTGAGIEAAHLDRIFDPFFTTKPVGKGTGLGLSVSYGIVREHNGRIDVASELGKGTVFRVWLPVRQAAEAATEEALAAVAVAS